MRLLFWTFLFSFLISVSAFAQVTIPQKPQEYTPVNDFAKVLTEDQEFLLNDKLKEYEDSTSTQIAIVLIETLSETPIEDYAQELAVSWGIGQKGKDNGLLILAVVQDQKMRIHVGYGLEASITDLEAATITKEILKPNFKKRAYFQGLHQAVDAIFIAAEGEFQNNKATVKKAKPKTSKKQIINFILFGLAILAAFLLYWLLKKYVKYTSHVKVIRDLLGDATIAHRKHLFSWEVINSIFEEKQISKKLSEFENKRRYLSFLSATQQDFKKLQNEILLVRENPLMHFQISEKGVAYMLEECENYLHKDKPIWKYYKGKYSEEAIEAVKNLYEDKLRQIKASKSDELKVKTSNLYFNERYAYPYKKLEEYNKYSKSKKNIQNLLYSKESDYASTSLMMDKILDIFSISSIYTFPLIKRLFEKEAVTEKIKEFETRLEQMTFPITDENLVRKLRDDITDIRNKPSKYFKISESGLAYMVRESERFLEDNSIWKDYQKKYKADIVQKVRKELRTQFQRQKKSKGFGIVEFFTGKILALQQKPDAFFKPEVQKKITSQIKSTKKSNYSPSKKTSSNNTDEWDTDYSGGSSSGGGSSSDWGGGDFGGAGVSDDW